LNETSQNVALDAARRLTAVSRGKRQEDQNEKQKQKAVRMLHDPSRFLFGFLAYTQPSIAAPGFRSSVVWATKG
jgi:hypothetical protein